MCQGIVSRRFDFSKRKVPRLRAVEERIVRETMLLNDAEGKAIHGGLLLECCWSGYWSQYPRKR